MNHCIERDKKYYKIDVCKSIHIEFEFAQENICYRQLAIVGLNWFASFVKKIEMTLGA